LLNNECSFVLSSAPICILPSFLSPDHLICLRNIGGTLSHHLSSTSSIIGGTAYGQNITTATTGKYLPNMHISLSPLSLPFSFPPSPPLSPQKLVQEWKTHIIALPPTFFHCAAQAAWPSAAPALAERTAAYVLNCWIAGRWNLVRASAESTGLRMMGDIVVFGVEITGPGFFVAGSSLEKRALRSREVGS